MWRRMTKSQTAELGYILSNCTSDDTWQELANFLEANGYRHPNTRPLSAEARLNADRRDLLRDTDPQSPDIEAQIQAVKVSLGQAS